MTSSRQYDIILLGATGYTGAITAEYLHQHLPSNYSWAIHGRSEPKLQKLNTTLESLSSSRKAPPELLQGRLDKIDLAALAKKTRLILNCVGPYHLYSTPVVQACAETGTHYVDVSGEVPWLRELIAKFEGTAKESGAIIISHCGVESAPSDMLAYVATKLVRDVWDCGVMDMIGSVHELKSTGLSGGSMATALGLLDHYSMPYIRECFNNPFVVSPIEDRDHRHTKHPSPISYERTRWQRLTGVWEYPYLGLLTTSITAAPNVPIVQRSAGINQAFYSYNFTYEEYMRVSNRLVGIVIHVVLVLFTAMMMSPPFRGVAAFLVRSPGTGPARAAGKNGYLELRGVAVAEQLNQKQRKALASFRIDGGSAYDWTALLVAEAAVALLESTHDGLAKKFDTTILTPSCLGDRYVKRLEGAGVKIVVKQIGDVGSK